MKRVVLAGCLLGLLATGRGLWAAIPAAEDRYMEAFTFIQEGDAAERQSEWTKAYSKYSAALDILRELRTEQPQWNPQVLEFRIRYYSDHLQALKAMLPAPAPGDKTAPPAPAPTPPTPASAEDQIKKLTAELARAEDRIRELEQTQTVANAKAPKPAAAPDKSAPQISRLNKDMAQARDDQQRVSAELARAKADLARTQEDLATAKGTQDQLRKTETRLEEVTKRSKDLAGQLADAHQKNLDLQKQSDLAAKQQLAEFQKQSGLRETETIKILKAQLAQAREEQQRLRQESNQSKSDLDHAKADLADKDKQVSSARTAEDRLAELTRKHRDLTNQLATAKAQIADLGQKLGVAERGADDIRSLQDELAKSRAAQEKSAKGLVEARNELVRFQEKFSSLSGQLDKVQKTGDLLTALTSQNQDLSNRLADTQKQLADVPKPVAVQDTAEWKKLSQELTDSRAESQKLTGQLQETKTQLDQSTNVTARADELAKQNLDLSNRVAAAEKQLTDSRAESQKLTGQLQEAKTQLDQSTNVTARADELAKLNLNLSNRVAAAEQKLADAPKPVAVQDSAEWKKLNQDLADSRAESQRLTGQLQEARTQLDQSTNVTARADDLAKQNSDLSNRVAAAEKQLADAPKPVAVQDSVEWKKLNQDLADSRAELQKLTGQLQEAKTQLVQSTNVTVRADELARQNQDLSGQLAAATNQLATLQRPAAKPPAPFDLANLRNVLTETGAGLRRAKPVLP